MPPRVSAFPAPLVVAALAAVGGAAGAPLAFPAAGVAQAPPAAPAVAEGELDEGIRSRLEGVAGSMAPVIAVAGEAIRAATELPRFYEARGFRPAWVDAAGLLPPADDLLTALEGADAEGLDPADYHVARIRALLRTRPVPLTELELLLTDAFLLYGAHLVGGRVDPVTIHPEWNAARREADLVALLDSALATGDIGGALATLAPAHPGFRRLRDTLARYRAIAGRGGWPVVPGRTLRPGMRDPAVPTLRARLVASGDLAETASPDPARYDAALAAAVKRFQARHGLDPDGVAGLETNALLNVPVEERVRQLELGMERWRWLPRDLGHRHVRVNIAGFEAEVVEGDSTVFATRVMVGQRYRRTPVFSDRISYLVLNPTWTIPPNILEVDKLPLIREDPDYLSRNRIRVLAPDGREVDPGTVDWRAVTGKTSYRLRMDPGPENPLGQVKFMFPNPYFVYLHDTPGRDLFDKGDRAFSSGCIRVERPLDLAALLLRDAGWDRARIERAIRQPGEQTVPLPKPVPVHILYWTAWVEPDGAVQFRSDVYDRDAALDAALRAPPPARAAATPAVGGRAGLGGRQTGLQ